MSKKIWKLILAGSMAAVMLAGCGTGSGKDQEVKGKIVVGSKSFTEGNILSEIYALALEDAGYEVERKFDVSGALVHTAITSGEIDLYPEYTGTALLEILKKDLITDPEEIYQVVKKEYPEQFNLEWLDYAPMNDGPGIAVYEPVAEELGIVTISDLQREAENLRFASQGEFDERSDGLAGMKEVYGPFAFKELKVYDSSLRYDALRSGKMDVTPAYTTEAMLSTGEFRLLEDDKKMWPAYNAAPVVRAEILKQYPDIAEALNAVSAKIDTETITALNAKVDLDHEEYEDVAKEFFESIK